MMIRIMGSWTGFRVVLHPEHGLLTVSNCRHSAVVEIEMGDVDHAVIQRIGGKSKTMVLTRNLNLACGAQG